MSWCKPFSFHMECLFEQVRINRVGIYIHLFILRWFLLSDCCNSIYFFRKYRLLDFGESTANRKPTLVTYGNCMGIVGTQCLVFWLFSLVFAVNHTSPEQNTWFCVLFSSYVHHVICHFPTGLYILLLSAASWEHFLSCDVCFVEEQQMNTVKPRAFTAVHWDRVRSCVIRDN